MQNSMWSSQDEGRASSLYQKCEAGKANDTVLSQNLDILPLVLGHACIAVHLDIVRMLLRHDFDLDRKANDDETPLFLACSAPRYHESDASVIGRRSVTQQRVLGDLYLSNHLASFVIGDGVLSSRPAS